MAHRAYKWTLRKQRVIRIAICNLSETDDMAFCSAQTKSTQSILCEFCHIPPGCTNEIYLYIR